MNGVTQSYLIDILLVFTGLFGIVYILYGRATQKVLIGGHKPGTPSYDAVMRFVKNTKYLVIAVGTTLFFLINTIFDVRKILQSDQSHSILIVAPIMVIVTYALVFIMLPVVFGKKR